MFEYETDVDRGHPLLYYYCREVEINVVNYYSYYFVASEIGQHFFIGTWYHTSFLQDLFLRFLKFLAFSSFDTNSYLCGLIL